MYECHAIIQVVSSRFLIGTSVQSQVRSCGICCGQSGTRTCLSRSTSIFHCQCRFTNASYSFIYHQCYV